MTTFDAEPELQELTLNEIFNGCASFEGFCPVVCRLMSLRSSVIMLQPQLVASEMRRRYLDSIKCEGEERERIDEYIQLLRLRANGSLMTNAAWMRHFVTTHRDYKQDSRVSPTTCSDLMRACLLLADNRHSSEELHCSRRNSLVYSVDVCESCGCIDIVPEEHSCEGGVAGAHPPKPPPLPQAVPHYQQVTASQCAVSFSPPRTLPPPRPSRCSALLLASLLPLLTLSCSA